MPQVSLPHISLEKYHMGTRLGKVMMIHVFIYLSLRPSFNDKLLAAMSHYLVDLQTMDSGTPNIGQMVTNFRALQTQVQRIP